MCQQTSKGQMKKYIKKLNETWFGLLKIEQCVLLFCLDTWDSDTEIK